MITTVIFDIGKVLFDYDPGRIVDTLLPESVYRDGYLSDLFLAPLWDQLDRGDVNREGAITYLMNRKGFNARQCEDVGVLIDGFSLELELMNETKDLFEDLSHTYPIYILSNFQDKPFDQLYEANPFLHIAKGVVVSAKESMMKPEREIYELILNRYNLIANECVFIDDRLENITACQECGIHGIHFKNAIQCRESLIDHGVKI